MLCCFVLFCTVCCAMCYAVCCVLCCVLCAVCCVLCAVCCVCCAVCAVCCVLCGVRCEEGGGREGGSKDGGRGVDGVCRKQEPHLGCGELFAPQWHSAGNFEQHFFLHNGNLFCATCARALIYKLIVVVLNLPNPPVPLPRNTPTEKKGRPMGEAP